MGKIRIGCLAILLLVFTSCSQGKKEATDRLTVLCYEFQTQRITNAYLRARDPYQSSKSPHFITPEEDFSDEGELYDSLMAGFMKKSPDIDLFLIDSRDPYACQIIENKYYLDLSQDERLVAYFDDMYPEIVDWCSNGDAVFGFPVYVFYGMQIMADESKMEAIGYTADDIVTMDGLLDFCDAWRAQKSIPPYDGHYQSAVEYCRNYMLLHYDRATGELDLDTPEFRSLLSRCRELNENQPFFQEPYGGGNVITDVSPLYFGFSAHAIPALPPVCARPISPPRRRTAGCPEKCHCLLDDDQPLQ